MSEGRNRQTVVPLIWYDKPREAIAWLEKALGFDAQMIVAGAGEEVIHSELTFGDGVIYVVGPSFVGHSGASPRQTGGRNTQSVHLNLDGGLRIRLDGPAKTNYDLAINSLDKRRGTQVRPDGALTLHYSDFDLFADELAGYGPEVLVISPPELRDAVRSRLTRTAADHG